MNTAINPEFAFLGPRVWNKPISLPLEDEEDDDCFSLLNIDDFLNENNSCTNGELQGPANLRSVRYLHNELFDVTCSLTYVLGAI